MGTKAKALGGVSCVVVRNDTRYLANFVCRYEITLIASCLSVQTITLNVFELHVAGSLTRLSTFDPKFDFFHVDN